MPGITELGGLGNVFICKSIQFSCCVSVPPLCPALWLRAPRQFRPILESCRNKPGMSAAGTGGSRGAQKRLVTRDDVWGHFLSWKIRELT